MMNKNNLNTKIEILNNKKYFVLKLNDYDKVLDFEINMIKNNQSLSFLEMEVVQRDSERKILYSIADNMSFLEFIQVKGCDISTIIEMLEYIYKRLNNMKDYMLDNKRVLLNPKYIFVDINLVSYMLYLPFELTGEYEVEKEFNSLCDIINKEIKMYDYKLTNNDKKIMNRLVSGRVSFDKLSDLFLEYKKRKEEEKLLEKPKKTDDNLILIEEKKEELETEEIYVKKLKEESIEKSYKSVIEEDYSKFKGFEEEEELDSEFYDEQEYSDINSYEKRINSEGKNKSIVVIQLIVLMILGSLGLVISYDDKKIFIGISIAMAVVIVIFTFLIFSGNGKKEGK